MKLLYIRETAGQSLLRDAGTFATCLALVGVGWLAGSSALEWVGAIMFFLVVIVKANRRNEECCLTPQEAADKLRREFGVVGREPGE